MSEARFYETVEGAFRPLLEFGYEVVERHYSAQSFGNGWVTFKGQPLLLQVMRDRSQHFVEFSVPGTPATRISYAGLLKVLGRPSPTDLPDMPLEEMARRVLDDLPAIQVSLNDRNREETAAAVRRWQEDWEAEVLGRPPRRDAENRGS